MSIPRDLQGRTSPATAADKINAAYELGGPRLTRARRSRSSSRTPGEPVQDQQRDHVNFGALPPGRQLHRRRLRRHRPPLLQRQHAGRRALRDDRRPPRLPEAQGPGRARLRPLPPRRQRPRARRAPAGLPAPDRATRPARRQLLKSNLATAELAKLFARYFDYDKGLRQKKQIFSLLKLVLGHRQAARSARCRFRVVDATDRRQPRRRRQNMLQRRRRPLPAADEGRGHAVDASRRPRQQVGDEARKRASALAHERPGPRGARTEGEDQAILGRPQDAVRLLLPDAARGGRRATSATGRGCTRSATSSASATAPTGSCSRRASNGEYYGVQGMTWRARRSSTTRTRRARSTAASC